MSKLLRIRIWLGFCRRGAPSQCERYARGAKKCHLSVGARSSILGSSRSPRKSPERATFWAPSRVFVAFCAGSWGLPARGPLPAPCALLRRTLCAGASRRGSFENDKCASGAACAPLRHLYKGAAQAGVARSLSQEAAAPLHVQEAAAAKRLRSNATPPGAGLRAQGAVGGSNHATTP